MRTLFCPHNAWSACYPRYPFAVPSDSTALTSKTLRSISSQAVLQLLNILVTQKIEVTGIVYVMLQELWATYVMLPEFRH